MKITNPLPNVSNMEWLGFLIAVFVGALLVSSGSAGLMRYFGYCQ